MIMQKVFYDIKPDLVWVHMALTSLTELQAKRDVISNLPQAVNFYRSFKVILASINNDSLLFRYDRARLITF